MITGFSYTVYTYAVYLSSLLVVCALYHVPHNKDCQDNSIVYM